MNVCLLMMGGSGTRFGGERPKQFVLVDDMPVFAHILSGLEAAGCVDRIILVTHPEWLDDTGAWARRLNAQKVFAVVAGGENRSESVRNGLEKAAEITSADDVVMLHDATHPYVDVAGIRELAAAAREYGGATLGQRQYDTCYRVDEDDMLVEVVPRRYFVSGASPEAFLFGKIYPLYEGASREELATMTSAGAIALAHGIRMKVCTLHTINLKLTYPEDLELFRRAPDYFIGRMDGD